MGIRRLLRTYYPRGYRRGSPRTALALRLWAVAARILGEVACWRGEGACEPTSETLRSESGGAPSEGTCDSAAPAGHERPGV
eukprot:3293968-Alexandrium_andersonii.AAC.1